MPDGGKRRAQAARRREQLLAVAQALFSERGYRGTSVRDITRAAGVTEAVLYHYFANKADLWAAVLATYAPFGQVDRILEEAAATPLEEALGAVARELLRLLRERQQLVLTLLSEAPVEPDVARVLEQFLDEVESALAAFFARRQARGEIAADVDVAAAAHVVQGALLVRLLTTALTPHGDETAGDEAVADRLARLLVGGLAPRHEVIAS
jgi:TetR/AcrR family transcriptional repressor of mexJK operon